jgi:hypothetical protein
MGVDAYGETAVEGTRIFERLSSSLSQSDIGIR